MGWRYRAWVFTASFLLFAVELLLARMLLPQFGSSAQVWATALMFYQGALFAGYLYAAKAARFIREGRYLWAHLWLLLLPAFALPFRLPHTELSPILAVVVALAAGVGLPFFALSTTSVIAQAWLSRSGSAEGRDPYFLYGVSNAGALAALLGYPLLVEPLVPLGVQRMLWYGGYALFVLLAALAARAARSSGVAEEALAREPDAPEPAFSTRATWLLFPLGANALLMAATNAVTLDAPLPLLWVVPLTAYLLTLILTFARRPLSQRGLNLLAVAGLLVALGSLWLVRRQEGLQWAWVGLHTAVLFVGCLLLHFHLVRARPQGVRHLGPYYLALSLGGWLGSVAIAVAVPLLFRRFAAAWVDYAVAAILVLAAFLTRDAARLGALARSRPAVAAGAVGGLLVVAGAGALTARLPGGAKQIDGSRTFYGLYRVKDEGGLRWFHHGNTVHGIESLAPEERGVPLAYFSARSPVAPALRELRPRKKVAVIGLGAGSLAAWSRRDETWDFYELDPEVERIARAHFNFLATSPARVRVVLGDARLELAGAPDGTYDALVVDAFSSDFIPVHLVTREAFELYGRKLRPGGMILCHISNRILDLTPVLTRLADSLGLHAAVAWSELPTDAQRRAGLFESHWFLLTADAQLQARLVERHGFQPVNAEEVRARRPWTDDHLNLFHALR